MNQMKKIKCKQYQQPAIIQLPNLQPRTYTKSLFHYQLKL